MVKLVDANNPSHEYAPSFVRNLKVLPLEADAIRKRGLPVLPAYKIDPEPHYSCPKPAKNSGLEFYSAKIEEYKGPTVRGKTCMKERLKLQLVKGAKLSIEHTPFAVKVMCADVLRVKEIPPGEKFLVRISREEAARILKRNLCDLSCVYFIGESPAIYLIRPATLKDTEEHAQPESAMFMIGLAGVYPLGRITGLSINSEE